MKNLRYIALVTLILAAVSCNRNQIKISGTVEGAEEGVLALERLDVNRTVLVDSLEIGKGGRFSVTARIEEPGLFVLRYSKSKLINLLLFPGEEVSLKTTAADFGADYSLQGSVESENVRTLVMKMRSTRTILDSLINVASSIEDPGSPQMDLVRSAYAQAIINQKRFTIRYLVEHMHSLSSIYALYQKYDEKTMVLGDETDLQYFKTLADSLEVSFPGSSLTSSLRADVLQKESDFEQDKKISSLMEMAGDPSGVLDLSIPDREGREISLSSLKGKVVLMVFWASGNGESIDALLRLRSTYEKYHSKGFEIYAISLDNNRLSWLNSMDFNEFGWINVCELSYPDSRAMQIYNVTSLPFNYLLNREGDLVAKNIYGRTLETWLDNLL
jgi:hypothetical protein